MTIYEALRKAVRDGVQKYTWRGYSTMTGVPLSILQRIGSEGDDRIKHTELLTLLKIFPEARIVTGSPLTLKEANDAALQRTIRDRESGVQMSGAEVLAKLQRYVTESPDIPDGARFPLLGALLKIATGRL